MILDELLDLVKHYYGPRMDTVRTSRGGGGRREKNITPNAPDLDRRFDRITAFHEAVAELPVEKEREVIGLTYYHDWSQQEIAALFQVSVRTVQRWLDSAMEKVKARIATE